jgi:hypothetical protein
MKDSGFTEVLNALRAVDLPTLALKRAFHNQLVPHLNSIYLSFTRHVSTAPLQRSHF